MGPLAKGGGGCIFKKKKRWTGLPTQGDGKAKGERDVPKKGWKK